MKTELKKKLDKYEDMVYNLRIGCEGIPLIEDLYNSFKIHTYADDEYKPRVQEALVRALDIINKSWNESGCSELFPSPPMIAGGCLRDLMCGFWPNDIDVFINTHDMDLTTAEDEIAMFVYGMGGIMEEHKPDKSKYGKGLSRESDFNKESFVIFNRYEDGDIDWTCALQIIGRDIGPPESLQKPLDFCRDFDYNLVMAAMTLDGEIHLSKEFMFGLMEKSIIITRPSGKERSKRRFGGYGFTDYDLSVSPKSIWEAKLKERQKHLANVMPETKFERPPAAPLPNGAIPPVGWQHRELQVGQWQNEVFERNIAAEELRALWNQLRDNPEGERIDGIEVNPI